MSGLPIHYLSTMHLPFNRTCLDRQLVLQGPNNDPGGPGFGVLLSGGNILISKVHDRYELPFGSWSEEQGIYLGLWQGQPCRLVDLDEAQSLPGNLLACALLHEHSPLSIELLSLAGLGRTILHWQERSRFCGYCGQPTDWLPREWGKSCTQCHSHAFPAIHPCAIVLVTRPGEVLLTRKSNWAPNRYSLVAGFQEFAESLEETAVREVAEETGIAIDNVRYVGSQSWPFPSQVMVGFVADYVAGDIQVEVAELEDARWFPVDALPGLPPKRSIARYILDTTLGLC